MLLSRQITESAVDENMNNSTDVLGIDPTQLGYFRVCLTKARWMQKVMDDEEYNKAVEAAKRKQSDAMNSKIWDAKRVAEDSFSKNGITCAIG